MALAAGGAAWWWSQRADTERVDYRTGTVERGTLVATVSASGNVNPVAQVSVSSQISGQIRDLYADFNSEVKAGQLLAQIDPATFEYRVRSAEADLDAARANVLTVQAQAAAARAAVSRAQSDLAEAGRIHDRNLALVAQGFIAQSEADRTRAALVSAQEALKGAQAQVAVTEAQIRTAQATATQREAQLAQARVDLGRTEIKSPVSGIVIKRAVERGQTVAASLQAPEMFVIAQNLSDMQVDVSVDEADVGRIRPGQKASFTVDAFAGQTFEGEVAQVRKAAQNVANVVTYVAVVRFQNPLGRLLPGMTANVRIVTDQRADVLKVPNAALRVRLPGVETSNSEAEKSTPSSANGKKSLKNEATGAPPAGAPAAAAGNAPVSPAAPGGAPGAGGPSGPGAEFRQRLQAELQLSPAQQTAVEAVYADARPRFMALRDLPEADRPRARERVMADIRARIGALLTPEQAPRYAALLAESSGRAVSRGRVHVLGADGQPVAHAVRLGLSDGAHTELLLTPGSPEAQALTEGATVITGLPVSGNGASAPGGRPPSGSPRPPF